MVVSAPGYCKVVTGEVDSCSVAWEDAWDKYQQHQRFTSDSDGYRLGEGGGA